MEAECIVYFHPMREPVNKNAAAKKHWWQDALLRERVLGEEETGGFFAVVDCPVPPFCYRKKRWQQEALSEAMERVVQRMPGMTDALVHPEIMTLMSEKYVTRWEPRRETMERLMACLIRRFAAECLFRQGSVTAFLGSAEDTFWQMEMTERLLAPYLPRINSLLFYYEETAGADVREETAEYLEAYSYGYGLVPDMRPYTDKKGENRRKKERITGVILDYATRPFYARIGPEGQTVYLDLSSDSKKEQRYGRKGGRILYASPLKYLDTIVKSSYDSKSERDTLVSPM